jgi:3-oxoacyl-[acyl-carrier protein] reductase
MPSTKQASAKVPHERLLEDHVAIIGGGTSGMGETTAWRFAREGAKVAIHFSGSTANSVAKAQRIVDELTNSGFEAMSIKADITVYADVKRSVDSVVSRWGKVSSVVDFAGLPSSFEFWQEDPLDLSDEDLLSAIGVDFIGSYHFIRASRDYMKKEHYGKIVLISSSPTVYGDDAGYRYILAKDLNRITVKSLAVKLMREYGISLNAIAPGTIATPANRVNYSKKGWSELVRAIPIGRAGLPDEIAGVALFLCSHLSDLVVGQTIVADGGEIRL